MEPILQAVIASVASFSTISLLFLLLLLLRRRTNPSKPLPLPSPAHTLSFDPSLPRISLPDLASATNNFSPDRILGDGSFGFVYKAILPSGAPVAVKRLSPHLPLSQASPQFRAEIQALARIHHPNLTRLLAFCAAASERLLVYEFLPGGSLDNRLHDPDLLPPLTWPQRLHILRGVAAGLRFLHDACSPSIIHRDIKASNVLLDGECGARISDFGLARLVDSSRSHVTTQEAAGTAGYMAPEYGEGVRAATAKGDVYSFGVLVMEVVAARRPSWPVRRGGGEEVAMVEWVRGEFEAGRELGVLDPLMGKEGVGEIQLRKVLGVACRATEVRPCRRLGMAEVVRLLDSF